MANCINFWYYPAFSPAFFPAFSPAFQSNMREPKKPPARINILNAGENAGLFSLYDWYTKNEKVLIRIIDSII